jgi:hypothetical protein
LSTDAYPHDGDDALLGELVDDLAVEQAREVAVEALVAADELVGKGQALRTDNWHQVRSHKSQDRDVVISPA